MFAWFKKKKSPPSLDKTAFLRAVHSHSVERRAQTRIRIPSGDAIANLPHVEFADPLPGGVTGKQVRIINISVGGMLVENEFFKRCKAHQRFNFRFIWSQPDKELFQQAELLRIRDGRGHFKFENAHPSLLVNLSIASKAAALGHQMRPLDPAELPPGQLKVLEAWSTPWGDGLFFETQPPVKSWVQVHYKYGSQNLCFISGRGLFSEKKNADGRAELTAAPKWLLEEAFLLTTNISEPSESVKKLLRELHEAHVKLK